ncbi:MAG: response regulator [Gemmatimonadaceae bacterium]|jgi:signal transduction histidine kinase/CheY-like chemotaxis protein|nr:response regulator [Gemmatimonadaceae bacterium]
MSTAPVAGRLGPILAWLVPIEGPPIEAWRRRILAATLLSLAVFGLIAYVPSVWLAVDQDEWAVVVLDTIAYLSIVGVMFARRVDYRRRAWVVLFFVGSLGVFFLTRFGPFAAGFPWLLAFPIVASVLLGLRQGLRLLVLTACILIGLGVLLAMGRLPWVPLMPTTGAPPLVYWTVSTLSVLMLAALATISVGVLVDGLGREATARAEAEAERSRLTAAIDQSGELVLLLDPTGDVRYGNTSARALAHPALLRTLMMHWDGVHRGTPWAGILEVPQHENTPPLTLSGTLSPVRDDVGAITGMLATLRDIARERVLQQQLQEARKLEAVGTLAGGIAHDFNNLLQPIVLNTEAAQAELPSTHAAQPLLRDVRQAAESARALIRRILTFTRDAAHERRPLDLGTLVRETERLLRTTLPTTVRLESHLDDGVIVQAEPGELQQVLLNLATNAVHAMPAGGVLTLRVTRLAIATHSARAALANAFPAASHVAWLEVEDTGAGMSPDTLARAFDPFFSTKGPRGGTGLGLAMVHGTVTALGGLILPDSAPGRGTRMSIALPLCHATPQPLDAPTMLPAVARRRRVVLIDDDPAVLAATARLLERSDCDVVRFQDARAALATLEESSDAWDCVITDLTMPTMSGLELADAIHARHPALPIVLMTGYLEDDAAARFARPSLRLVLSKPFTSADLQRALDTLVPT